MTKRGVRGRAPVWLVGFAMALSTVVWAQGNANFSGTWKLDKFDPPLPAGRGGGGGRGGGAPVPGGTGYDENVFGAVTQSANITQTASELTIQTGPRKATYTLDGKQMVVPPGDVNGLKTWAHWDGAKLHLHFKQGQNWGRDVLSFSGGTLTILRDLDSGGGSTTRTLTYSKTTS